MAIILTIWFKSLFKTILSSTKAATPSTKSACVFITDRIKTKKDPFSDLQKLSNNHPYNIVGKENVMNSINW